MGGEHECPEDNGNYSVVWDDAREEWAVFDVRTDGTIIHNIVYCPFCGKFLGGNNASSVGRRQE